MRKFLSVLVAMVSMTALLMYAFPLNSSAKGEIVYTENFEDGKADTFLLGEQKQGTYQIVKESGNHILKLITHTGEDENGYFHYIFGPDVGDYFSYTLRFRPDNIKNPDFNFAALCFRCQPYDDGGEPGHGENESYIIQIWDWRAAFAIKSAKNFRGSFEAKVFEENQDFYFENGKWYNIKIEGRKNAFKVYVDNKLALEYTDPKSYFKTGEFAFTAWGANISVDDISIATFDSEAELNAGIITSSSKITQSKPDAQSSKSSSSAVQSGSSTASEDNSSEGEASASGNDSSGSPAASQKTTGTDINKPSEPNWTLPIVIAAIVILGGGATAFLILKNRKNQ